jgi:hypothetical protein
MHENIIMKLSVSYTKMSFSKMENRKVSQVLSGGWHQWEGEDIRKG